MTYAYQPPIEKRTSAGDTPTRRLIHRVGWKTRPQVCEVYFHRHSWKRALGGVVTQAQHVEQGYPTSSTGGLVEKEAQISIFKCMQVGTYTVLHGN